MWIDEPHEINNKMEYAIGSPERIVCAFFVPVADFSALCAKSGPKAGQNFAGNRIRANRLNVHSDVVCDSDDSRKSRKCSPKNRNFSLKLRPFRPVRVAGAVCSASETTFCNGEPFRAAT